MVISLVRILLVISAILFLQSHYKQPYSPPPESSQPSLPLARDNGKKRRRARRKQKRFDGGGKVMSVQEKKGQKPPFRLLWLSGAMKQRITDLYDEVLRTTCGNFHLNQVCEFINCLVDARNELLQKSENVQRSFRIKKAMLYNAHNRKSSYDHLRLCEQMMELHAVMEKEAREHALATEAPEISFEELLAQEKDAAFWQRNGKLRSISGK